VAKQQFLGPVPGVTLALTTGDIVTAVPILGNGQIDVEGFLIGRKGAFELLRRGRRIRARHVEEQAIGKDSRGRGDRERSAGQSLAIDFQFSKSPRAECQRGELKLE